MDHFALFEQGIHDFVQSFRENPFDALYERDLQAMLFASCRRVFAQERVSIRGGYHPSEAYPDGIGIQTTPVKCEYPLSEKFDVAMIGAESVIHFEQALARQRGWKNDRFWEQPVRAAVELKYLQLGDDPRLKRKNVDVDVAKLQAYLERSSLPFLGISLVCIQTNSLNARLFYDGQPIEGENAPSHGVFRHVVTPSGVKRFVA